MYSVVRTYRIASVFFALSDQTAHHTNSLLTLKISVSLAFGASLSGPLIPNAYKSGTGNEAPPAVLQTVKYFTTWGGSSL